MTPRNEFLIVAMIVLLFVLAAMVVAVEDAEGDEHGRWVYVGPGWEGVMRCESKPSQLPPLGRTAKQRASEVRIDQTGGLGERTGFQILRSTWDGWARERDADYLIGRDPWRTTLAQQLRQATHGRRRYGISQWSCGRHWGSGDGWVFVTGEHKLPKNPQRCATNLETRWGIDEQIARSVCNDDNR